MLYKVMILGRLCAVACIEKQGAESLLYHSA